MGNGKPFGFSNKIDDPSFDDVVLEFGRAIIVMVPDLVPVAFSRTIGRQASRNVLKR